VRLTEEIVPEEVAEVEGEMEPDLLAGDLAVASLRVKRADAV